MAIDLDEQLADTLPLLLGAVLAASFLLLMVVFRSVVVALKATVMNLLSIGAAYGVVVAVFQWGWLGGLIGLQDTYLIASPLPAIFFAVLFGLSMDYEVFLVSRIREAYDATGDNVEAVARGLAATGRVITCGALDHDGGLPVVRGQPEPVREDDRPRARGRHRARRDGGADGPGARRRWRCSAARTGGCRRGSTVCSRSCAWRAPRQRSPPRPRNRRRCRWDGPSVEPPAGGRIAHTERWGLAGEAESDRFR